MNLKTLSPIAYVLAILCLFLPFISLSCEGQVIDTKTGFELATGFTQSFEQIPPNIYIILFIMASVIGLIFSLYRTNGSIMIAAISGGVGITALILFIVDVNNRVRVNYEGLLVVVLEYGFYLAGLFTLAAILLNFSNQQAQALSGARTQAYVSPGPGGRQLNRTLPQSIPSGLGNIQVNQTMPSPNIHAMHPPARPPVSQVTEPMGYSPTAALPRNIPQHYQHASAGQGAGIPRLVGISGQYAGQIIDLSAGQITIGRDPSIAHLVYMQKNNDISRKHCTVGYDASRQSFTLTDSSTNGTFLFPQERLIQGKPVYLDSGTRFFISDPSEQFEVRLD